MGFAYMRAYEFLVEYDRSITIKNTKIDRLIAVANVDPFFQKVQNKDDTNAFVDIIFEAIESRDPSPNKVYVPWLARVYAAGGISVSQLNGNGELGKYHTAKGRGLLSGVIKNKEIEDFTKYKTYQSFVDALNAINIDGILSAETKAETKAKVDRGTYDTLLDQGNATVVIPRDLTAAMFWGQNTTWCTAERDNNKFEDYKDDPIYVISPRKPEKKMVRRYNRKEKRWDEVESIEKYQISFVKGEVKDSNNIPYDFKLLVEKFPLIYGVLKNDSNFPFKYLSKEDMTEDKQLAAVIDGENLRVIFDAGIVPSEDVQVAAVTNNGNAIDIIINAGIVPSEDVQVAAVTNNGNAIDIIINAGIVPSEDVQVAAISNGAEYARIINAGIIPSEDVQVAAVTKNSGTILDIIKAGITPSERVQIAAVAKTGSLLLYIIKAGITPSERVQIAAVTNDSVVILEMIDAGITPSEAVQIAAVTNNRFAIDYEDIIDAGITPSERVKEASRKRKSRYNESA